MRCVGATAAERYEGMGAYESRRQQKEEDQHGIVFLLLLLIVGIEMRTINHKKFRFGIYKCNGRRSLLFVVDLCPRSGMN